MTQLIRKQEVEFGYEDKTGGLHEGHAIVEYIFTCDDGMFSKEITGIYIPEHVPAYVYTQVKSDVAKAFHNGWGVEI